jgi:hypothetical protein
VLGRLQPVSNAHAGAASTDTDGKTRRPGGVCQPARRVVIPNLPPGDPGCAHAIYRCLPTKWRTGDFPGRNGRSKTGSPQRGPAIEPVESAA